MPRSDIEQLQVMPSETKHNDYVPTVPSDWPTVPDTVQKALDTPSVAVISDTAPASVVGRWWLDLSASGTGGTGLLSRITTTVDLTLTISHTFVKADASSGPLTITVPPASANGGRLYLIKKIDPTPNTVTIEGDGDDTIEGASNAVLTVEGECIGINADSVEDNWDILMAYQPQPLKTEGGQKKAVVSDDNVAQLLVEMLVELRKTSVQLAMMNDNVVSGDELN